MRIRPGVSLAWAAGFLLAAGLFTALVPQATFLIPVVIVAMMIMLIADATQLPRINKSIVIEREAPIRVGRGIEFKVTVMVINHSSGTISGQVRDSLPEKAKPSIFISPFRVKGNAREVISYEVHIPVRGKYVLGPIYVRAATRCGFLEIQTEHDVRHYVKVLPESVAGQSELEKKALAEALVLLKESRTRLRGAGLEFESLSEYRPGDDVRRIDWRSSARHNHLVIRKYQVEQHRDVMLLLDSGRLMGADTGNGSKLDRAVDAALMLARIAVYKGDRCGVAYFDSEVRGFLPPVSGASAMQHITEALYDVQSQWHEVNFLAMFSALQLKLQKRTLIIVLSDFADEVTTQQYRTALHSLGKRHLIIFVALRTPLLDKLKKAPVEERMDVSRKAVVMRLLRQRERALDTINRGSVHVLDVEPREITVPLVNKYISLRERNML